MYFVITSHTSVNRLRSGDLISPHTEAGRGFGSVSSIAKWHKRPPKHATLCHFFGAFVARSQASPA